jgi:16S rRNA (uracil1498-N3)-methyltransferase
MSRRVPIGGLGSGERRLEGQLGHYVGRVLRARAGDGFVAFDPDSGAEADATVLEIQASTVVVRIGALRKGADRAIAGLILVQGLAKGDKCDAIVRDATELGVNRVIVTATNRSVVRLDPIRSNVRRSRWQRIAREAARQSGRSDAPAVEGPLAWVDALDAAQAAGARFCLWELAPDPLGPCLFEALDQGQSIAFACGPEGGFDDTEVAMARERGWRLARIGPLTLRTETVAAAVLGAARIWAGMFAPRP